MGQKLLDVLCEQLSLRMASGQWISVAELSELVRGCCRDESHVGDVLGFLKKYFLDVDEEKARVRLSSWAQSLFQVSVS